MESLCYMLETRAYADEDVPQNLLQRDISSVDTARFARLHEHDYMAKRPPPSRFAKMELDASTHRCFNALTKSEQRQLRERAREQVGAEESR